MRNNDFTISPCIRTTHAFETFVKRNKINWTESVDFFNPSLIAENGRNYNNCSNRNVLHHEAP